MPTALTSPINEKLREAVLYILSKCCTTSHLGYKALAKLLYFADFNYYKKNYAPITNEQYRRLDHGPVPVNFWKVLSSLEKDGAIEISKKQVGPVEQYTFKILKPINIEFLTKSELKELDHIIAILSKFKGGQLEWLSHEDIPWQVTDENKIIDYDLVFYRTKEISQAVE